MNQVKNANVLILELEVRDDRLFWMVKYSTNNLYTLHKDCAVKQWK